MNLTPEEHAAVQWARALISIRRSGGPNLLTLLVATIDRLTEESQP